METRAFYSHHHPAIAFIRCRVCGASVWRAQEYHVEDMIVATWSELHGMNMAGKSTMVKLSLSLKDPYRC